MPALKRVAYWLMVIGAINWGLVGLGFYLGGNYNLVNILFGSLPEVENLIYVLIGLSGGWFLWDRLMAKR